MTQTATCVHCEELRTLLRDLREYTAKVESALAPWILTRSYVHLPDGWPELRKRLDAEIGPLK